MRQTIITCATFIGFFIGFFCTVWAFGNKAPEGDAIVFLVVKDDIMICWDPGTDDERVVETPEDIVEFYNNHD
jgi:hypothetical protein